MIMKQVLLLLKSCFDCCVKGNNQLLVGDSRPCRLISGWYHFDDYFSVLRADQPKQPPSVKNVNKQDKQPVVVKQTSERKSVASIPKKVPTQGVVNDKKSRSREKVVVPVSLKSLPDIMQTDKTALGDLGGVSIMREDLSMKTLLKEVDTQAMPRVGRSAYAKIIDEIFDQQAAEEAKQLQQLPVKSMNLIVDLGRSVIYVVPSEFTQESETTQSSPVPFSDSLQEQEPVFPSGRVITNAEQPDGDEK
uniref:Uncharacterized protein n=1 Tax=Ditylenchus dipsaci TaxID=166011 RepID=A0A915DZC9_9BILA